MVASDGTSYERRAIEQWLQSLLGRKKHTGFKSCAFERSLHVSFARSSDKPTDQPATGKRNSAPQYRDTAA